MGQDEPRDAGPDQLADQLVDGRRRGAPPGERGQPLGPRVEADRQPVAGDREARAEVVGPVGDASGQDDAGRTGGEREPDRVGRFEAAGELERDRDARRDRADRLEVRPGAPARAPSKSTRWISRAPCATNRSAIRSGRSVGAPIAGRGAGPVDDARPAALEVDRRDDLHRSSRWPRSSALARQQAPVEADRQRAVAQQRVVEALERERVAEPALLVGAELEQQVRPSRYDSG